MVDIYKELLNLKLNDTPTSNRNIKLGNLNHHISYLLNKTYSNPALQYKPFERHLLTLFQNEVQILQNIKTQMNGKQKSSPRLYEPMVGVTILDATDQPIFSVKNNTFSLEGGNTSYTTEEFTRYVIDIEKRNKIYIKKITYCIASLL